MKNTSAVGPEAQAAPPWSARAKSWLPVPENAPASGLALTSRVGYQLGNQVPDLPDAELTAEVSTGSSRIELQYLATPNIGRRLYISIATEGETATVNGGIPVSPEDLRAFADALTALAARVDAELPAMEQRIAAFAEALAPLMPADDDDE